MCIATFVCVCVCLYVCTRMCLPKSGRGHAQFVGHLPWTTDELVAEELLCYSTQASLLQYVYDTP